MSASILLLPAAAIAAAGAFLDIRDQRLPNWLCAALALAALTGLAFSQGAALLPWALLHAAVAELRDLAEFCNVGPARLPYLPDRIRIAYRLRARGADA